MVVTTWTSPTGDTFRKLDGSWVSDFISDGEFERLALTGGDRYFRWSSENFMEHYKAKPIEDLIIHEEPW